MAKKLEYLEVMWAEQKPDVYSGPNCDEHRPDWYGGALGDKGGSEGGMDVVELKAEHFPAGTKIVISVPLCPECGDSADLGHFSKDQKCDCGFDWKKWADGEYS